MQFGEEEATCSKHNFQRYTGILEITQHYPAEINTLCQEVHGEHSLVHSVLTEVSKDSAWVTRFFSSLPLTNYSFLSGGEAQDIRQMQPAFDREALCGSDHHRKGMFIGLFNLYTVYLIYAVMSSS